MAAEGPFAVDPDSGFLVVTRALDREEQAEYQLQVWLARCRGEWAGQGQALTTLLCQVTLETEDGHVLWGPQRVIVHVKDENDKVPQFSQAVYRARLSQGTRPGE